MYLEVIYKVEGGKYVFFYTSLYLLYLLNIFLIFADKDVIAGATAFILDNEVTFRLEIL